MREIDILLLIGIMKNNFTVSLWYKEMHTPKGNR